MRSASLVILLAAALIIPALVFTQSQPPPPLDGPQRPFQDSLVDRLQGQWRMTGQVHGRPVEYSANAEWVLGHQFLRLSMVDVTKPPAYQADVYIGYDNTSERYVAHWLDTFGGRFSETLGYGRHEGDAVHFVFEYPDGPFHTIFTAHADGTWNVLMRTKDSTGAWVTFGEFTMHRRQS